jgi:hypothetical protein
MGFCHVAIYFFCKCKYLKGFKNGFKIPINNYFLKLFPAIRYKLTGFKLILLNPVGASFGRSTISIK